MSKRRTCANRKHMGDSKVEKFVDILRATQIANVECVVDLAGSRHVYVGLVMY